MIKNQHLLFSITIASFLAVLVCVLIYIRENNNTHDLAEAKKTNNRELAELSQQLADAKKSIQQLETRRVELASKLEKLESQHQILESKMVSKGEQLKIDLARLQLEAKMEINKVRSDLQSETKTEINKIQSQLQETTRNMSDVEKRLKSLEKKGTKTP